jgi:hypothetical protein
MFEAYERNAAITFTLEAQNDSNAADCVLDLLRITGQTTVSSRTIPGEEPSVELAGFP